MVYIIHFISSKFRNSALCRIPLAPKDCSYIIIASSSWYTTASFLSPLFELDGFWSLFILYQRKWKEQKLQCSQEIPDVNSLINIENKSKIRYTVMFFRPHLTLNRRNNKETSLVHSNNGCAYLLSGFSIFDNTYFNIFSKQILKIFLNVYGNIYINGE